MDSPLETLEIETGPDPRAAVVFLHGLGADGHDFEPLVPLFAATADAPIRFVLPHAPVMPVTVNGGAAMRAWYDILSIDIGRRVDEDGVRRSSALVDQLLRRELERGVPADRLVVAGFSQGGALALHAGPRFDERLAGVVALSSYPLRADALDAERAPANDRLPILMGHGTHDPVVSVTLGMLARETLLERGYPVEWHEWPMGHEVCEEEVAVVAAFLAEHLAGDAAA